MRTKTTLLLSFIFFINISCVHRVFFGIQNKTGHDIQIHRILVYDLRDSILRKNIISKGYPYQISEQEKMFVNSFKTLKNDSIDFIDIIYAESSKKRELIDPNNYYYFTTLKIVSELDTISYNVEEIIKKINEIWNNENLNSHTNKKHLLIWKFENPLDL